MIHCFEPVITQPSPSGSATVRSDPASDPDPGSVSAKAPIVSPRARGGTKRYLLVFGAEVEDRKRGGARVHGDRHPDSRIGARELLEHEHVRQEVGTRATVGLRNADPHEPEVRELRVQLVGEAVLTIPRGRVGHDLRLGELPGQ